MDQSIKLPKSFKAAGISAGIKKQKGKDLALIFSEVPAVIAGVFTTNQVQAASVKICREHLKKGCHKGQAIIINSGNANTCTGPQGLQDAQRMASLVAELLAIPESSAFVCSTGKIGVPLPMPKVEVGIQQIVPQLSTFGGKDAAEAIMTTDTTVKYAHTALEVDGKTIQLTGVAKGSGMIEPHMATMLSFLMTDAAIEPKAMQSALKHAVTQSFNRISVDGDMSTNDTVLFLANGTAENKQLTPEHPAWNAFNEALKKITLDLALKIVSDGEGATKQITIKLNGAVSDEDADRAARAVANSMLVKTSWAGQGANWGRIVDALGYCGSKIVEELVDLDYDDVAAVRNGQAVGTEEHILEQIVARDYFSINIDLHLGAGEATVYTCNCTEEYVRINV